MIMARGSTFATPKRYIGLFGGVNSAQTAANIWNVQNYIAASGRIGFLQVTTTQPGSGNNKICTMFKNGVATDLTVTVSDLETTAIDAIHSVRVSALDTISFELDSDGTSYTSSDPSIVVMFFSDNEKESIMGATVGEPLTTSTNATQYMPMYDFFGSLANDIEQASMIIPTGGAIVDLFIELQTAPGSGSSRTFTILLNEVATSKAITISNTNTTGSHTGTLTVSAGDRIQFKATTPGTAPVASKVRFGYVFKATTEGEFILPYCSGPPQLSTSSDEWATIPSTIGLYIADSLAVNVPRGGLSVLNIYVELTTAPGSGFPVKRRRFTLWKNDATAAISVLISRTTKVGNDTDQVDFAQGDTLSIKCIATNTPAASYFTVCCTAKMPAVVDDNLFFSMV